MKKLAILFLLFFGLAFAQAPLTVFGDLNVGGGHLNPGVGIALPLTTSTSLPVEVSKSPGTAALTFGLSHNFAYINKDSIGASFDLGFNAGRYSTRFVHEYAVGYSHWINQKWSAGPYVKFSEVGGSGSWSAGATVSFRWYR